MGTDCTSACLTTSVTIQSRDESIFKKFTYSVKIALSLAVYADDYPQFVLKINDYLMFLFVTFFLLFLQCCGSGMFIPCLVFFIPDLDFSIPYPGFSIPDLDFFISDLGCLSWIWIFPSRISDLDFLSRLPDLDFSILDSGSGIFHPVSRICIFTSRIHIRNTALTKILSMYINSKNCH